MVSGVCVEVPVDVELDAPARLHIVGCHAPGHRFLGVLERLAVLLVGKELRRQLVGDEVRILDTEHLYTFRVRSPSWRPGSIWVEHSIRGWTMSAPWISSSCSMIHGAVDRSCAGARAGLLSS